MVHKIINKSGCYFFYVSNVPVKMYVFQFISNIDGQRTYISKTLKGLFDSIRTWIKYPEH